MFVEVVITITGETGVFIKKFKEHDLEQRTEYFLEESWNLYKASCQYLQTSLYSPLVVKVETYTSYYEWDHVTGYRSSIPVKDKHYIYTFEQMPFWVHFNPK
jgi:hypothetical protein